MFERYREVQRRRAAGEGGFTLIELLVVIVVLGILAAVVILSLSGVSGTSKQAACTTDAKSVETAVDAYEAANSGTAPAAYAPAAGSVAVSGSDTDLIGSATLPSYLHAWPSTTNGYAIEIDSSGNVEVWPNPSGSSAAYVPFDTEGSGGCSAVS